MSVSWKPSWGGLSSTPPALSPGKARPGSGKGLAIAEERERKQELRLVGVILGGLYGLVVVVFLIPRFDSLMGLLIVLGLGTAMAAWLSTGTKRVAYAGWQMGIALLMTILQEPHPVTELDVAWNRFVGIVLGVIAMRLAFAFPSLELHPDIAA